MRVLRAPFHFYHPNKEDLVKDDIVICECGRPAWYMLDTPVKHSPGDAAVKCFSFFDQTPVQGQPLPIRCVDCKAPVMEW